MCPAAKQPRRAIGAAAQRNVVVRQQALQGLVCAWALLALRPRISECCKIATASVHGECSSWGTGRAWRH